MKFHTLWAFIAALFLVGCGAVQPTSSATSIPPTARPTLAPQPAPATDVERGQLIFRTLQPRAGFACITCHFPTTEERLIGPGLGNVSQRAEEYSLEDGVEAYLRRSILEPNAFLAPGQPPYPALMPRNYGEVFSDEQLDDLIAYLLTL